MSSAAVRMPLAEAAPLAEKIAGRLRNVGAIVHIAGSVRRQDPDVGDMDFVVLFNGDLGRLCQRAGIQIQTGQEKRIVGTYDGKPVNVWRTDPECLGAALFKFTGPVGYVIGYSTRAKKAGMKLSELGLFDAATGKRLAGDTEESIYAAFGKSFRPPEERGQPDSLVEVARKAVKHAARQKGAE